MSPKRNINRRQRTTLGAKNGGHTVGARLDLESQLALAWAEAWLTRAAGLQVSSSTVIRLALLQLTTAIAQAEQAGTTQYLVKATEAAAAGKLGETTAQEIAKRLEGTINSEGPLLSWHAVRYGSSRIDWEELEARAELLIPKKYRTKQKES